MTLLCDMDRAPAAAFADAFERVLPDDVALPVSAAVLDVTEPAPLPADHPVWAPPEIMLGPHVASVSQPSTAAIPVSDNSHRHLQGRDLIGLVDRNRNH